MKNSYRFFENRDCDYFPCHRGLDAFNCLFCYCPFYLWDYCPGAPNYLPVKGCFIKDCSNCTYPHVPAHYDDIMKRLGERAVRKEKPE